MVILLLTLWPLPEQAYRASLSPVSCLVCGDQGMQDVIQNIILFLPLGLALGLAGVRPRWAALSGFALSFLVELLQYTVVTGRDASLSDVLTNTTGAALGAMLAPHLPTLLRPERRAAARLAVGMACLWALAWVFGAWALEGNLGAGHWRGRFPNDLPDAPPVSGDAISASLDGVPITLAPVALPVEVEQQFARDSFLLRVALRPGPPRAPRENVVTVIDVAQEGTYANNSLVLILNRVGPRAFIGYRINAARVLLRTPSFNLGPAFDVAPGALASIEVARARGELRADANGAAVARYRIGPELLWSVLVPRTPRPGLAWILETFLWAAVCLGVAGHWAGRSRSATSIAVVCILALSIQAATPRFLAVAPQSLLGWALLLSAVLLGVATGWGTQKGPHP